MKTAVNLLLVQDGLALAVSRRNDPQKWGLPGGKVDPGETSLAACLREAAEETGVVLLPSEVTPLMSCRSEGEVHYWTTTYLYIGSHRFTDDQLVAESGLYISWRPLVDLADPNISPFAVYNQALVRQYNDYRRE